MRFVVDTNVLFSFFWKNSFTKRLLEDPYFELFSPKLACEELERHSSWIIKKTHTTKRKFNKRLIELKSVVDFVSKERFDDSLKIARRISLDKDDADFFALALKLRVPIWSNDKQLKQQDKVLVLSTEDVVDLVIG